ncbi:hypothetical protein [Paenibacillus harenae]|uniref:hypothetical protein n=1 Tax=Paenibacillus harenae TaxID=306543 RepID=UPI0027D85588|nr:hypothetical protein [Paenibacillus harenae]
MNDNRQIFRALASVIDATGSECPDWIVGGSAGLLLRKLPLQARPRDLDLYCDDEDVDGIYDKLNRFAIDEPEWSETDIYRSRLCHFDIEGVSVELVGGFEVTTGDSFYHTEVKRLLIPYGDRLLVEGTSKSAHVVPLAHELWFNALRAREDRVQLIAESFNHSADGTALRAIEAANRFSEQACQYVHSSISEWKAGTMC